MANVALVLGQRGDEQSAAPVRAAALTLARSMRNPDLVASVHADSAAAALVVGDVVGARRHADRCAEIMVRVGHGLYLAGLVRLQAAVAAAEGDLVRARCLAGGHRRWADPGGWIADPREESLLERLLGDVPPDPDALPLRELARAGTGRA
jgi:hypothetical protein